MTRTGSSISSNCTSCEKKNLLLPIFDELNKICIADATACPATTIKSTFNKACIKCTNVTASVSYTHSNKIIYEIENDCICKNKKVYPLGITTNTPIAKPSTIPSCVASCAVYNLYFKPNGFVGGTSCESCEIINSGTPLFNELSGTCVALLACPGTTVQSTLNKMCIKCSNIDIYQPLAHINAPVFELQNSCICENKKYYPSTITTNTPTPKPGSTPICVPLCSTYNLYYIADTSFTGGSICTSCNTINASTPLFDELSGNCVASLACPLTTVQSTLNNMCIKCSNVDSYQLLVHANAPIFELQNSCICASKKYYPSGIDSSYTSPVAKPASTPVCVLQCTDYNLSFISDSVFPGGKVCTPCKTINAAIPYFDESTLTCVAVCPGTANPATTILSITNNACIKCSNITSYKGLAHTGKIVMDFIYCFYCEPVLRYTYESSCVNKCPGYWGGDSQKLCVNCKTLSPPQYNYQGDCYLESNLPV